MSEGSKTTAETNNQINYHSLVQSMVQGVVFQSAGGEIIAANSASERILGLTLDQMKGRTSMDPRWKAIKEDGSDFPGEEHPAMVALASGKEIHGVVMGVFHPRWDRYKWIRVDAVPLFKPGEDSPYQVVSTFNDITEQKIAEKALKNSEQLFRHLFEATTEGIAIHEMLYDDEGNARDYRLIDVNPSYTAHTTITREMAMGALASELYGGTPPPFLDLYAKVAASGEPMSFETFFEPMDKHFSIAVFSPSPGRFATVFEDITARKKAEAERETKVKLQGAMEMAGAACHELNQPLQIITSLMELMAQQTGGDPELDQSIDMAIRQLQKMGRITGKIQSITRYETKTYMGDTRIFDLDKASRGE
jgi:PAS domain S-box-containing protein